MRKLTSVLCLVAILAIATHVGRSETDAASFFNFNQVISVTSNTWNYTGLYNYNSGTWSASGWHFGNNTITYQLPYGAWFALLIWDDALQKWDEIVYLFDENR